jgi:hypothetical protein
MKVINVKNWEELALNRKAWNDLVEESETQKRVVKLVEEDEEETLPWKIVVCS